MTKDASYQVPQEQLSLSGPIVRPDAESLLPMRGDLAHIGLAHRYLVAHYVVPEICHMAQDADMKRAADEASETVVSLKAEQTLELLDIAGVWAWVCLGPEGPSGYVAHTSLKP